MVRTVFKKNIAELDEAAGEIVLLVHWMGRVHTELLLQRRRRGQRNSTSPDVIDTIRQLVLIESNDVISGMLNRNGLRTGHGNRWTRERVTALRFFFQAEDGIRDIGVTGVQTCALPIFVISERAAETNNWRGLNRCRNHKYGGE